MLRKLLTKRLLVNIGYNFMCLDDRFIMKNTTQYLLASIVESSQDSIVTIDLNHIITSWNKGAEDLYGFSAEEAVGQPLSIVMLPADIKDLMLKIEDIINEISVPLYQTVRMHKNGKLADLEIFLSPVRSESGQVIGISTVARDITLRKMQEEQKDEFIAVASHELKTPVTSIKAYAELLLEESRESENRLAASFSEKLNTEVDKLINLMQTLLDTTKLSAGQMLLKCESFDLNELIKEVLETFKIILKDHQCIFNTKDIIQVYADKNLISRVIINLLSNAVKFSPKGSQIIITVSVVSHMVKVSVQDFGPGIPEKIKNKIFHRYYRTGQAVLKGIEGIGLGLYISHGIISQHGGNLDVISEEGKGCTFSFSLPVPALV